MNEFKKLVEDVWVSFTSGFGTMAICISAFLGFLFYTGVLTVTCNKTICILMLK